MASKTPPPTDNAISPEDLARKVSRQAIYQRELPTRFYKSVATVERDAGFALELDGKPVKTPMKNTFKVPTRALAEAVAQEWQEQETHIDPDTMPLSKFANTAIDRVTPRRKEIIDEITEYAGSDLLCYRAVEPRGLVERQAECWDPLLRWSEEELGAKFVSVQGIVHCAQPENSLLAFRETAEKHDDFTLAGLHNVMTMTGSAVLALALIRAKISSREAWSLAHVDEDWQIEFWGEDEDAKARRVLREAEFEATHRFVQLASM